MPSTNPQSRPRLMAIIFSLMLLPLGGCELGVVGGEEEIFDDGTRESYGSPGSYIGKYWTTYYYLANQSGYPGSGYPLYSKGCNVIVSSTYAFYKAARMEGSAKLNNGGVINYAGSCSCGGSSRTCFKLLDSSQPWGQGAFQNALVPLRSIAVDKNRIKLGSTIYIKQWDGQQIPKVDGIGGFVHDGCFRADDTGGAVKGSHYDFFAGTKAMWKALEKVYGTKTNFSIYRGGSKCAYVSNLKPGQSGGNNGGNNGGSNGGNNGGGYGDCFYGGERGTCQEDHKPCAGSYKGSLCPGGNNVRCCMPPAAPPPPPPPPGNYGSCSYAARTGTCQSTSISCDGGYKSGLCPGNSGVQCCLPSWGSCNSGGKPGNCQLTSMSCGGGYKSGLCPGPNDVKCCIF
jgi:3D (Asp-Asp-Asp) domain-containing protein